VSSRSWPPSSREQRRSLRELLVVLEPGRQRGQLHANRNGVAVHRFLERRAILDTELLAHSAELRLLLNW